MPPGARPSISAGGILGRRGGDDDPVVGLLLGPALAAVAEPADDVGETQFGKARFGLAQQFAVPLDREHPAAEPRQDRGLVAGARADFQDIVAFAGFELFGHQGYDIGLADGLPGSDRERGVFVGLVEETGRHELFPRRLFDSAQHPRIADPGAAQLHQEPQLFLDQAWLGRIHAKSVRNAAIAGQLVRSR